MTGLMDKVAGTLKEAVGKITGDKRTKTSGKGDRAKGEAKGAAEDVKQAVKGVRDSAKKR